MNQYKTNINAVGSIPDYDMIYSVQHLLAENVSEEKLHESLVINNRFGIRTQASRARFLRVVRSAFWQFRNQEHETLIRSLFLSEKLENTKPHALFWMMGINNALFESITNHVFFYRVFFRPGAVDG